MTSTLLQFHGTSIAPPEHVVKAARKTNRRHMKTAFIGFATSVFTAPAVMVAATVSSGSPGIVIAVNAILGTIAGTGIGFSLANKAYSPSKNKTVKNYSPTVAEWLKATYNVELVPSALSEMTDVILGNTVNYGVNFFNRLTSAPYVLKTEDNYWVLVPASIKGITSAEKTRRIPQIKRCEETSPLFDSVKQKIDALTQVSSTPEMKNKLTDAAEEVNEIIVLVEQLKELQDPDYADSLNTALGNVDERLTCLAENERIRIKEQFAALTTGRGSASGEASQFLPLKRATKANV